MSLSQNGHNTATDSGDPETKVEGFKEITVEISTRQSMGPIQIS